MKVSPRRNRRNRFFRVPVELRSVARSFECWNVRSFDPFVKNLEPIIVFKPLAFPNVAWPSFQTSQSPSNVRMKKTLKYVLEGNRKMTREPDFTLDKQTYIRFKTVPSIEYLEVNERMVLAWSSMERLVYLNNLLVDLQRLLGIKWRVSSSHLIN